MAVSGRDKRRLSYLGDWVVVVVCALIATALYSKSHSTSTLLFQGPENNINTDQAYPFIPPQIPTWFSISVSLVVSHCVFVLAFVLDRRVTSFHHASLGIFMALILSSVFAQGLKIIIGGIAPNFLSVCKPDFSLQEGHGYNRLYFDRTVCTGDPSQINTALESFSSGNSTAAFGGMFFLALWLNARLKPWSDKRGRGKGLQLILVFAPIWVACNLSLTRIVDHNENGYDILAGAVIGITFAAASYRSYYRSLFDAHNNHIPLVDEKEEGGAPDGATAADTRPSKDNDDDGASVDMSSITIEPVAGLPQK